MFMEKGKHRILVPIGEKTRALDVLKLTILLKNPEKYIYTLLGLVKVPFITSLEINKEIMGIDQAKKIRGKLKEINREMNKYKFKTEVKVATCRDIADGIVEESNRGGYDLIILIKRRGKRRFFEKSVSKEVIERAEIPVLLLRSD